MDSTVFVSAERQDCTVLELLAQIRDKHGDEPLVLSVMTAAELIHGVWRAQGRQARARREGFVEEVLARVPVRGISLRLARIAGRIDAECRARGKTIPTVDLYIGVTALDLGFRVCTSNQRHFRMVPGLRVVAL